MKDAYFNEFEPFAAEWLGNLYPEATVDDRSIKDVSANDLRRFRRCHFFAGIGGWEYALELAGWPADRNVWTGSCPCQPFSSGGKQQGEKDERHLWPEFYTLISQHRPSIVFGEQVASPLGREWLDGVSLDLEELGYAVGASDLCAAGIDAPHIRQRLFWVAYADSIESRQINQSAGNESLLRASEDNDGMANTKSKRSSCGGFCSKVGGETGERTRLLGPEQYSIDGGMGDANEQGSQERIKFQKRFRTSRQERSSIVSPSPAWPGIATNCRDGKSRRIPMLESGIQPLAYGLSRSLGQNRAEDFKLAVRSARTNRVGRLKGYGNAIVPKVAAVFIRAFMEATSM